MQKRIVISLVSWLSSSYAIYLCVDQIYLTIRLTMLDSVRYTPIISLLFLGYPWVALGVMNFGWVKNKKVHWFWLLTGTITALVGLASSFGLGFVLAPLTIVLALYLVYFHIVLAPASSTHQAAAAK